MVETIGQGFELHTKLGSLDIPKGFSRCMGPVFFQSLSPPIDHGINRRARKRPLPFWLANKNSSDLCCICCRKFFIGFWTVLLTIRMSSLQVLSSRMVNILKGLSLYKVYIHELGDLYIACKFMPHCGACQGVTRFLTDYPFLTYSCLKIVTKITFGGFRLCNCCQITFEIFNAMLCHLKSSDYPETL
jgi:hypothetical protein